jgi:ABC-type branched-subunit amino acid transport system substrate-binding protein
MTLVPNRLPPLSGNRRLMALFAMLVLGSCAPKVQQWVSHPSDAPVVNNKPVTPLPVAPVVKTPPPTPKVSVISLLLPFGLDHIGPGQSYTDISLKKARIAADYYRGFDLALDSLTYYGYNYKLQLFDTRDDINQAHNLAYDQKIRQSDLIVGPIFPDGMKAFSSVLTGARKPIVSPLSPEPPSTFSNQNMVTVNPPLEYHAWCAAQYINDHIKPQKIFILRSGFSDDNDYIIPFVKAIDSLSKGRIKIISVTIVHGQLASIIPQLAVNKDNIFIIPSTNEQFLTVTLHSLDMLTAHYPVVLFGHPSWQHFDFLKPQLLQHLNTHITSADNVDYKSPETVTFIRNYRNAWHAEPSAYAIKGFDEGLYFGRLLSTDNIKHMEKTDFTGLNNSYSFKKKPGLGWINTHVNLLVYSNFELKKAE